MITNFWWNYTTNAYDIIEHFPLDKEVINYLPNTDICRNLYYKLIQAEKNPRASFLRVLELFTNE